MTSFWGQPGKASTRKVKPIWILIKQETLGWQWPQLDHMQIIFTTLQTDNHTRTSSLNFFTGRMLFLMPNQQYRGTEGKLLEVTRGNSPMSLHMRGMWEGMEFPHVPSHERNGGGNGIPPCPFTWEEWGREWEWFAGRTQIPSSWRTSPWRCCRSCFGHQSSCVVTTTRLDTTQSEPSATCCDISQNTLSVLVSVKMRFH